MTDLASAISAALDRREALALAAASECGCHPPTPVWTFADDENDGRIVIEGDPHPSVHKRLATRWNRNYSDLFHGRFIAAHDPVWVLRDIAAKRKVLERRTCETFGDSGLPEALDLDREEPWCRVCRGSGWPCAEILGLAEAEGVSTDG